MKEVPYPLNHHEIYSWYGICLTIDERWGSHSSVKLTRGGKTLYKTFYSPDYQTYSNYIDSVTICTGKMRWENI